MKMSEVVRPSGAVKITAIFDDFSKLLWVSNNTLTMGFIASMPKLLAGQVGEVSNRTVAAGTGLWASYMKVGSGTTPPATANLDLEDEILDDGNETQLILPVTALFDSAKPGNVIFSATLPGGTRTSNYNNSALTEVGLYNEAGTLLARFVYPSIAKSSTFQLNYTWTISFGGI